jgi:anti-sigma regulatory factor (Ser/Thr protein kinase)
VGNERSVRSLDPSAERFSSLLDVLVEADRVLAAPAKTRDALSKVAQAAVSHMADFCAIELEATEGAQGVCVLAGELPPEHEIITERLSDGQRTIGTMRCATAGKFDDLARKVLEILATGLGAVLASRALMLRERRVADRLQRALLPERLPTIDGVRFWGAYRPASDESEVGGDWFDSFTLPDGRIAISVGDVAGHGLDAAIVMGEVRQAIRTAAVAAESAAAVLHYVNRTILLRQTLGVVTAIFGIYDPASSLLVYSSAGHPPPLLAVANSEVKVLPAGGLPLGCTDEIHSPEWTFTVPTSGHVVFYTDGLIENERNVIAGEKRLIETVHALFFETPANGEPALDPADALLERMFSRISNRDDAAALILSRTAAVPHYVFSAVPVTASLTRAIVGTKMDELGVSREKRFGALVAVGEAIANAIEHAYRDRDPGLIRLEVVAEGSQIELSVEDFGHWRPFVRGLERGRGIEMMRRVMDRVQIRSSRDSTKVVLKTALA